MFIALPTTMLSTEEQYYTCGLPQGNLETSQLCTEKPQQPDLSRVAKTPKENLQKTGKFYWIIYFLFACFL